MFVPKYDTMYFTGDEFMDNKDKILFEQYFHTRGENPLTEDEFKQVINILLNIKEISDSALKLGNKNTRGKILTLTSYKLNNNISFISSYCVSNGIDTENRIIEGIININESEILVSAKITRFNDDTEILNYDELFKQKNNKYYRFTLYPNNSFNDVISLEKFAKYKLFEEETLNRLRK